MCSADDSSCRRSVGVQAAEGRRRTGGEAKTNAKRGRRKIRGWSDSLVEVSPEPAPSHARGPLRPEAARGHWRPWPRDRRPRRLAVSLAHSTSLFGQACPSLADEKRAFPPGWPTCCGSSRSFSPPQLASRTRRRSCARSSPPSSRAEQFSCDHLFLGGRTRRAGEWRCRRVICRLVHPASAG